MLAGRRHLSCNNVVASGARLANSGRSEFGLGVSLRGVHLSPRPGRESRSKATPRTHTKPNPESILSTNGGVYAQQDSPFADFKCGPDSVAAGGVKSLCWKRAISVTTRDRKEPPNSCGASVVDQFSGPSIGIDRPVPTGSLAGGDYVQPTLRYLYREKLEFAPNPSREHRWRARLQRASALAVPAALLTRPALHVAHYLRIRS